MRVLVSMLLLIGFAVGAAEPTQTFTDDLGRKVRCRFTRSGSSRCTTRISPFH